MAVSKMGNKITTGAKSPPQGRSDDHLFIFNHIWIILCGAVSDLRGSPRPFGFAVVPLVGVSSKYEPGAERRNVGQLGGCQLLEDTNHSTSCSHCFHFIHQFRVLPASVVYVHLCSPVCPPEVDEF